ncbi:unnamed protein product [Mucor hiemalis]
MVTARTAPQSKATGVTSTNKMNKILVYPEYTCYICGNVLSSAISCINHVRRIHGFELFPRLVGRNRPPNNEYEYSRDKDEEVDELHYACCSCWFTCPEDGEGIQTLNNHVREEHDPQKVDITKEGSDMLEQRSSRGTSRRGSVSSNKSDSSNKRISRAGTSSPPRFRSTTPNGTPITEKSALDISSKLDELINLFKKYL